MKVRPAVLTCSAMGLAAAGFLLGGCDTNIYDTDIKSMSGSEVRSLADEATRKNKPERVLLIDPRPEAEFTAGHIPNARNVHLDHIAPKDERLAAYTKFDNIVVYGNNQGSTIARAMTKRLLANKYRDVYWFAGGLEEWRAMGGELATGAAKVNAGDVNAAAR